MRMIAKSDLLKWNWPTPTWSDTSNVKLSENPKMEMPTTSNKAPRFSGEVLWNQANIDRNVPMQFGSYISKQPLNRYLRASQRCKHWVMSGPHVFLNQRQYVRWIRMILKCKVHQFACGTRCHSVAYFACLILNFLRLFFSSLTSKSLPSSTAW